jgi:SpoVK/Ycf46/Vps4 family AAA+-type ATPase
MMRANTMATAEQLKALLKCHSEGDDERFYAVALQVAATAAKQGHANLARELRTLVDEARAAPRPEGQLAGPTPVVQPRGELAGLLTVSYSKGHLDEMVLPDEVRARLDRLLREQRQQARLREHGLRPRNRVLLLGPPGSGKTMTASVLAGEMHLPLFSIQFDGLITKFMGETAAKLRLVFDAIHRTRGVYLFDELDAIGGNRALANDVGEIRRVLNSFLQFLEQESSQSVIVAATNHPELLDGALFRRFDDVIEYGPPSADLAARAVRTRLAAFDLGAVAWADVATATSGLSYADLGVASDDVVKAAVLDDRTALSTKELVQALDERRRERPER